METKFVEVCTKVATSVLASWSRTDVEAAVDLAVAVSKHSALFAEGFKEAEPKLEKAMQVFAHELGMEDTSVGAALHAAPEILLHRIGRSGYLMAHPQAGDLIRWICQAVATKCPRVSPVVVLSQGLGLAASAAASQRLAAACVATADSVSTEAATACTQVARWKALAALVGRRLAGGVPAAGIVARAAAKPDALACVASVLLIPLPASASISEASWVATCDQLEAALMQHATSQLWNLSAELLLQLAHQRPIIAKAYVQHLLQQISSGEHDVAAVESKLQALISRSATAAFICRT